MKKIFLLLCFATRAVFSQEAHLLSNPSLASLVRAESVLNAKKRILQASYIIREDQQSGLFNLELLRRLARQGKEVYLIVDGFSAGHWLSSRMQRLLVMDGVKVGIFNPLNAFQLFQNLRRLHDKLLIVDSEEIITGDRNIGNEYFGLDSVPWQSLDVYLKSPQVAQMAENYFFKLFNSPTVHRVSASPLKKIEYLELSSRLENNYEKSLPQFEKTWQTFKGWRGNALAVKNAEFLHFPVETMRWGSYMRGRKLLEFLSSAKKSLEIITPYFVPPEGLRKVLKKLMDKHVNVRIITNSWKNNNQKLVAGHFWASLPAYARSGLEIWEYRGDSTLHAKAFIVDDVKVGLGSFNADYISFRKNSEVGLVIDDKRFLESSRATAIKTIYRDSVKIAENGELLIPHKQQNVLFRCGYWLLRRHL